jgi:lipopolysaccharide transport system permease protein
LFVWRDFVAVYRQTILGPAWHILQSLFMTLTFTVIFGKFVGVSTDGPPPFLKAVGPAPIHDRKSPHHDR